MYVEDIRNQLQLSEDAMSFHWAISIILVIISDLNLRTHISHYHVSARPDQAQAKSKLCARSLHVVRTWFHQHPVSWLPWVHHDQVRIKVIMFYFNDSLLFQAPRKERVASSGWSAAGCLVLGSSSASFPGSTVVFHSTSPVWTRSPTLAPIARGPWEDTAEDSKTELQRLTLLTTLLFGHFCVKF